MYNIGIVSYSEMKFTGMEYTDMSIMHDALARLQEGTHVRLTLASGQIYDGIVRKNDGFESLAVEIRLTAALKYAQIVTIEQDIASERMQLEHAPSVDQYSPIAEQDTSAADQSEAYCPDSEADIAEDSIPEPEQACVFESVPDNDVVSAPAPEAATEMPPEHVDVPEPFPLIPFYTNMMQITDAFKAVGAAPKKILDASFHKLRVYGKEKCIQAANAATEILQYSKYEKDPAVHTYLTHVCVFAHDWQHAADCFVQLGSFYNAAWCILQDAYTGHDKAKFEQAAMYAAVYLMQTPEEEYAEAAAEVLFQGTIHSLDIGAVEVLARAELSPEITALLEIVLQRISIHTQRNISTCATPRECVAYLKAAFPVFHIVTEIWNYLPASAVEAFPSEDDTSKDSSSTYDHTAAPAQEAAPASEPTTVPDTPLSVEMQLQRVRQFAKDKCYTDAVSAAMPLLETEIWQTALDELLHLHLTLWKRDDDPKQAEVIDVLLSRFEGREMTNMSLLETISQYYHRSEQYEKFITLSNRFLESDSVSVERKLNFIYNQAVAYRAMHQFDSAIASLQAWLKLSRERNVQEKQRGTLVYPMLAELYLHTDAYNQAMQAIQHCEETQKVRALRVQLEAAMLPHGDATPKRDAAPLPELSELFAACTESVVPELSAQQIAEQALAIRPPRLYCLLAYLAAAEKIYTGTEEESIITALHTVFATAFHSPLATEQADVNTLFIAYERAKPLLPHQHTALFAACALRALFADDAATDVDFIHMMEQSSVSETYSMLLPLADALNKLYLQTGFRAARLAGEQKDNAFADVINEAIECCNVYDGHSTAADNHSFVQNTRELMFKSDQSELRHCMNIVVTNDLSRVDEVRDTLKQHFIRKNCPVHSKFIDKKKIDAYIDRYWKAGQERTVEENGYGYNMRDKFTGTKRMSAVNQLRKGVICLCKWVVAAESDRAAQNPHAMRYYGAELPNLLRLLDALRSAAEAQMASEGFDWGTESLRMTAEELSAKLGGTYDARNDKYLFVPFLLGEEVLLGDDFMPELQSTFVGISGFSVLERISRHAKSVLPTYTTRVQEIFGSEDVCHNLRSAKLIRRYAQEMNLNGIADLQVYDSLDSCREIAAIRHEQQYQRFRTTLALDMMRGKLPQDDAAQTALTETAAQWAQITRVTEDYGFYVRLLAAIQAQITKSAPKYTAELTQRLEALRTAHTDFGAITPESIEEQIADGSETIASYLLDCVERGDTAVVPMRPRSLEYLESFFLELEENCEMLRNTAVPPENALLRSCGARTLEAAMKPLSNTEDVAFGCQLLRAWHTNNAQQICALLQTFGFADCNADPTATDGIDVAQAWVTISLPFLSMQSVRVISMCDGFSTTALLSLANTATTHTMLLLDTCLRPADRRQLAFHLKMQSNRDHMFLVLDRCVLLYLARHAAPETVHPMLFALMLPFSGYQPDFAALPSMDETAHLDRAASIAELTTLPGEFGFIFDEDVVQLLLATTNGNAVMLRQFCQRLFEVISASDYAGYREAEAPPYRVTMETVQRMLRDGNFFTTLVQPTSEGEVMHE